MIHNISFSRTTRWEPIEKGDGFRLLGCGCILGVFITILPLSDGRAQMVHYPTIDGNHVIIDYSEVKATEEEHEFTLRIAFDGEHTYVRTRKGAIAEPDDMAQELEASLKLCGVKCERVGKTKVRVLGIDSGGKF